ncbi:hypothetical protein HYW76_02490 [Candidatus Pacearchaeota archaeon]|nr:hypothetical protein [Candidatus Pacearchaeota archaeon]
MEIKDKKSWLDYLFYEIGKQKYDFYLEWSYEKGINIKGKNITHGKWKKYSEICFDSENKQNQWFLEHCNQRQILPIEITLDLEDPSQLKSVISKLKEFRIKFYVFSTGSRGYHVLMFFNKELSKEEKLSIINYFGADPMKANDKCTIALEFAPHWKSGKIKRLIEDYNSIYLGVKICQEK